MRLIEQHTGVRFPSWCMNTVHWLSGGQSLIVRFNNKSVRDEIYRNRVPKSPEKRGLFIHESLTPSKMALVSRCAKLRNEGKIMTYYTQGGNVMVKKSKNTPGVLVTPGMTDDDIDMKLKSQPSTYRDGRETTSEEKNTGKEEKEGEKDKVEDEKQTQGEAVADTACEEQTLSQKDKQTASQAGHDSPVSSPGHRLSKKRRQALKRVH